MAHFTNNSIIIVLTLWTFADAARILGVFPHPSHSNQVVYRAFTMELARRGHELIVFTTDPANDTTLANYTEVDLHFFYELTVNVSFNSNSKKGIFSLLQDMYNYNEKVTEHTLSHPVMQRLISPNSTEMFDLIIVHCTYYDALYALSIRFDAPLIGISSLALFAHHHYMFGNPLLSAYSPDVMTGFDDNMNLWQRFVNLYYKLRQIYEYRYIVIPIQEKISRRHFGDSVPPVDQLSSRMSLLLVNSHPFYVTPRPNVPEIVYIGGCRRVRQKKRLPRDLEEALNDAKEGYIYFSLGSNIKSNNLPIEERNMLLRTFARLPYKVLWKFESDRLEHKPPNVMIRKWLPQQEILAHPNVRLFMYQGGLQSTEEAIENGVPVIGFPFIVDQMYNMKKLQFHGVGKMLLMADVDEEQLRETIFEVITNSSYRQNMLKLRNLLQDLPYHPMDNGIWWTEHVMRHKGASHLRTKSRNMPLYQIELLDIMVIALGVVVLAVCILVIVIKRYAFKLKEWLVTQTKKRTPTNVSRKKQQ